MYRGRGCRLEYGLKDFIHQPHVVDPSSSCVPGFQVSVHGLSKGHCGNLALDVQLEASVEFYH